MRQGANQGANKTTQSEDRRACSGGRLSFFPNPEGSQPLAGGCARHERHHRNTVSHNPASRRDASPDIMASTYLSLHYHLVFSTKNREALVVPEWRTRLHDYLGGTIRGLGGFPEGVG